jgi:hypothetical protein
VLVLLLLPLVLVLVLVLVLLLLLLLLLLLHGPNPRGAMLHLIAHGSVTRRSAAGWRMQRRPSIWRCLPVATLDRWAALPPLVPHQSVAAAN